ncbi:hypothetical protein HU200_021322 [Digitaria exilis]|uniref:Uncharacterized protein n=1 Tax=Digitaria exilis TaxID=1010633 RepID=A0A835F0C2_9POAL|nr:hypothetical protein HU200_021322 [Digitaria exilis]
MLWMKLLVDTRG